jgi:hypothetical protein
MTEEQLLELARALSAMPRGTLWCVGSMEDGPFARICYPMPGGGYGGGYCEGNGDTPADALRDALAKGASLKAIASIGGSRGEARG